ncbi:MAG: prolyl oligopeptidase family serine peptidase [Firmicutes bacterium]|nr:prolyl oligopeptidase family serine peptidase [Bacillota bacterium]
MEFATSLYNVDMDIYLVTYWSSPYWVKGYLGLPPGLSLSDEQIASALSDAYGASAVQTVTHMTLDHPHCPDTALGSFDDGRWPALLYCRGGIGHVGPVKADWIRTFSAQGFVVFAPFYRGSESGQGRDEFGGADVEDCVAAVRLLRALPFVQGDRMTVLGFSRGAVNAFQTVLAVPDIHRLIQWGGVADLAATYEERVDLRRMLRRVLGGTPTKRPEAYRARSAAAHAAAIPCPTLIIHGTADVQVDITHAYRLYDALQAHARPVDKHIYEGYGHHLPEPVFTAAVERFAAWTRQEV